MLRPRSPFHGKREMTNAIASGRLRSVFLDAQAKARLLFIPAAVVLVMFSTECDGSPSQGGKGTDARLRPTNVQGAKPAGDTGQQPATSRAAAETVALFSSNLVRIGSLMSRAALRRRIRLAGATTGL